MEVSPQTSDREELIIREAQRQLRQEDFHYWVKNTPLSLDGNPFSFQKHEYLEDIYRCMSNPKIKEIVLEKAAQMGLTVAELLMCFHGMRYGRFPKGVLYLLPTEHHMQKVSQTKIQPIIDENPMLQKWIQKTDSIAQKRIGNSNLIFHGMGSRLGLKSYSCDAVIFDEIEEIEDWSHVPLAEERMSHSLVEWAGETIQGGIAHRLSVPSVPGYGIDAFFGGSDDGTIDSSDQRYWLLKCQHCNEFNCLEDDFPDCLVEVSQKDQKAIRICRKCQRELDISKGQWIAKKPDQRIVGFHISQLFSAFVNPWFILDQFRKKKDLTTLFNDKLGIPYVESEARIEVKDILSLCGSDPQLSAFEGPAAMGIDQPKEEGGKFHVVISYKMTNQLCNIIKVCIRNTWNELAELFRNYNVARCVVDGLPDQSKARSFAEEFRGRVYLNYYAEKQKGAYRWNEDDLTVSVDRTESLNDSTRIIHDHKVSMPRKDDDILLFARHCHNMARKREEDKDTGSVRQVWVKTGPDHYRHAFNYCLIALGEIGEYVVPKKEKDWLRQRRRNVSWKTL